MSSGVCPPPPRRLEARQPRRWPAATRRAGGAARAELWSSASTASPGGCRRGWRPPPHLPLQPGSAERVVVLGRVQPACGSPGAASARRPAAAGAGGCRTPPAVRVGQGPRAAAARPIVLLQRAVLVEAPAARASERPAAPASEPLFVAVRPTGPRAVGVGKGRELIHGDGRHPSGEVLPGQHSHLERCWRCGQRRRWSVLERPRYPRPVRGA